MSAKCSKPPSVSYKTSKNKPVEANGAHVVKWESNSTCGYIELSPDSSLAAPDIILEAAQKEQSLRSNLSQTVGSDSGLRIIQGGFNTVPHFCTQVTLVDCK